MFVIDTNVASELMRPEPTAAVADWIAERNAQDMYLTAVSEAELLYGVAIMPTGKRRHALEAAMTRGAVLVTRNVRDFEDTELSVIDPWSVGP